MLFNSFEFIFVFLPISVLIYTILGMKFSQVISISWLVLCSFSFYAWWNPAYLILLLLSILFNYNLSGFIQKYQQKKFSLLTIQRRFNLPKLLLIIGITSNLALLGYFKYTNFFIETINQVTATSFNLEHIILPLAISFFTFQQVAYLVDSYRGKVRHSTLLNYSLFVSFFPQLIAGPIVHHKEMMPQFSDRKHFKQLYTNITFGLLYFSIGLFKKIILADTAGNIATPLFTKVANGTIVNFFDGWLAAISYSLQLYFDFSGYCDMAIGAALMFGILLPLNFNAPYKAQNIIDFWRRWHMTLGRFLKDYLYVPLGGNRRGSIRKNINLMITMLLGGMWHGAGWTFIVWGGLHGIYLITNHVWQKIRSELLGHDLNKSSFVGRTFSISLTLLAVVIAWIFFRSSSIDSALNMLQSMAGLHGASIPEVLVNTVPLLGNITEALGIVLTPTGGSFFYTSWSSILFIIPFLFFPTSHRLIRLIKQQNIHLGMNKATAYITSVVLLISIINLNKNSEFLYFQF